MCVLEGRDCTICVRANMKAPNKTATVVCVVGICVMLRCYCWQHDKNCENTGAVILTEGIRQAAWKPGDRNTSKPVNRCRRVDSVDFYL